MRYANAFKSNQTSREFYEDLTNSIYDQSFENAPNYYATDCPTPMEYEFPYGSNQWHRVEARVDGIVLPNTGIKSGNDYKNFIFKSNFALNILYGTKFRWKDSIWLVQNTDNMTSDMSKSCVVIRCNNVLRYFDENGNKICEPCHFDGIPRFTRNMTTPEIPISKGEHMLYVQRNERTKTLKPNQRFIFGTAEQRICLRITGSGIRNYINTYTEDENSASLTEFICEQYQLSPDLDDLENGFANAHANQFKVDIQSSITNYTAGYSGSLTALAYKNNNVIDTSISWKSTNESIATINEDGTDFTAVSAGRVTITAYMVDNESISATLDIIIEDSMVDNYVVQILPNIDYLLQTEEQVFEVHLYNKGVKQVDIFEIKDITAGVPNDRYLFNVIDNNSFSVKNLGMYMKKPVIIQCVSGEYSTNIELELRGLFK